MSDNKFHRDSHLALMLFIHYFELMLLYMGIYWHINESLLTSHLRDCVHVVGNKRIRLV